MTESISSTSSTSNNSFEVEEVMRSCGGAVQGIRDLCIATDSDANTNDNETVYHNRADDGFVYLDCGSYTSGAVSIFQTNTGNDNTGSNASVQKGEERFMTSFSLCREKRVLLDVGLITKAVVNNNDDNQIISLVQGHGKG
eukprot:CAMPEP_0194441470 /NCGR_PEP_ID=MMETSP0176-20130528/121827_1 /TAXON_ID=216777 /ORGANISM="Proboscia alata, Strain PI-D3" /LENGTH=140 /DNA_ID=CAMNT_0039266879 /DNA_START=53 /DNA_END=472 /DNA_ORIENTATION=+